MRRRPAAVSLAERITSIAIAIGATIGTASVFLSALPPHHAPRQVSTQLRIAGPIAERLVYVTSRAMASPPTARSVLPLAPSLAPEPSPALTTGKDGSAFSPDSTPSASSDRAPAAVSRPLTDDTRGSVPSPLAPFRMQVPRLTDDSTAARPSPSGATPGAPYAGVTAGFAGGRRGPMHYDSALKAVRERLAAGLSSGRLRAAPLTQAERDVALRAQALAVIAARAAGLPNPRAPMGGGGIAVPLPFGGPSRKQRERERAIFVQTMEITQRLRHRADSAEAARRRIRADSLAQARDSVRYPQPPPP